MDKLISVLEETNSLLSQGFNNNVIEIISIVISGFALIFAVLVPIRIANKQNDIALFEKRFVAYANLLKLKAFSDMLKKDECSFNSKIIATVNPQNIEGERGRRCSEVLLNFQAFFYEGENSPNGVNVARVTLYTVRNLELSLHTLPLLYSKSLENKGEDANKEITRIFEDLASFMDSLINCGPQNEQYRANFVANMDLFVDKYSNVFEEGIRL